MRLILLVALVGLGCSAGATYIGPDSEWAARWSILGITADRERISTGTDGTSIGRDDEGLTTEQIQAMSPAALGALKAALGIVP